MAHVQHQRLDFLLRTLPRVVTDMEMSIEFYEALKWSSAAFICGVFLREYAPDSLGKWLGRGGVLVSLCVMSAFGLHSARECVTLIQLVELGFSAKGDAKDAEGGTGHGIDHSFQCSGVI